MAMCTFQAVKPLWMYSQPLKKSNENTLVLVRKTEKNGDTLAIPVRSLDLDEVTLSYN